MNPIFRAILPEERPNCLRLWTTVFSPGEDYFVRYFEDPLWQADYTRVCVVNHEVVACVQIVKRFVRLNGYTLPMAGIANVSTHPDYRGHGFASHLIHDANRLIDEGDFLFGLLFTGINDFYARLGWHTMPSPFWRVATESVDVTGWRFRTAGVDDLPFVQACYEHAYGNRPASVVRDEAYWRVWVRWDDPNWRQRFYIAELEDEPRGYAVVLTDSRSGDGLPQVRSMTLTELATRPNDEGAGRALVAFVSSLAHSFGLESIELSLAPSDVARYVRPVLSEVRFHPSRSAMVYLSDPKRLERLFQLANKPLTPEAQAGDYGKASASLFGFGEDAPEWQAHFSGVDGF